MEKIRGGCSIPNPTGWDSQRFFGKIVRILSKVSKTVKEEAGGDGPRIVYVPVNSNGCSGNMASYPTHHSWRGSPRALQSPSLDIYYDACGEAGVRCKHAYIYRNPHAVIASTQKREFNADALVGIRMYTTQLHLIYAQMAHHRGGNVGCFGFLDPDGSKREEDIRRFGELFGFDGLSGFDGIMGLYNWMVKTTIVPMAEDEREKLVPPEWEVPMKAFVNAHERVIDLCYSTISE